MIRYVHSGNTSLTTKRNPGSNGSLSTTSPQRNNLVVVPDR